MSAPGFERDPYVAAFPENFPFWEAAVRGELLLPRCTCCGETHWHPRAHCPFCRSNALCWERASGRGRLHTFTLVRRPEAITVLAYVRLEEGPLMLTNIVDTPHEQLLLDMAVEVRFRPTAEGRHAPVFRCAGGTAKLTSKSIENSRTAMHRTTRRLNRRDLLAAGLAAATAPLAWAQGSYPSKPVRLIVPAAAGGATDIIGRLIAHKVTQSLPQPMVVENPAGGGGVIGTHVVARAPADGHTLLMGAINHTINASLVDKLPYDSVKDFTFIAHVVSIPNVLVVHPSLPAKNVAEFIALAKADDKLVFASSGNGTSQHLSAEMFRMLTGAKYRHVPYKGAAPAINDLLGGHVHLMFDNLPSAAANIRAGKVRALGVTSATRSPAFPDLPAIAETLPGFDVKSWFGLMGPAGLPKDVVDKLHAEMVKVFAAQDVKERLAGMGAEAALMDPPTFTAYVHREIDRWSKVVKASGAKVQ